MGGYHLSDIPKGEIGSSSKIKEELLEFLDAEVQDNPVMALLELSDMVGAIELYLEYNHPSVTLKDLITMKDATRQAFESGER